jgi:hypothetical protein
MASVLVVLAGEKVMAIVLIVLAGWTPWDLQPAAACCHNFFMPFAPYTSFHRAGHSSLIIVGWGIEVDSVT